jgi:hypothetical protein
MFLVTPTAILEMQKTSFAQQCSAFVGDSVLKGKIPFYGGSLHFSSLPSSCRWRRSRLHAIRPTSLRITVFTKELRDVLAAVDNIGVMWAS